MFQNILKETSCFLLVGHPPPPICHNHVISVQFIRCCALYAVNLHWSFGWTELFSDLIFSPCRTSVENNGTADGWMLVVTKKSSQATRKHRKVTQKKGVPTPTDLSRLSVLVVETYLLNEFGRIFCPLQRKFEMRRLDSQSLNWLWNRSKWRHFLDKDRYCINSPNAKCLLQ